MILRQIALQTVALAAAATTASAGTLIVGTYTGTKSPEGRTVEFRIQDGHGKITSEAGQYIYYDHAKQAAFIVDTEKGTSLEMNQARVKQMGAQLAAAQKQMEAQLKQMPPEKRAMVEKMLKEQGAPPPGGAKPLTFTKAGSAKVGQWSCDRYAASGDGRKVEVCAAEASTVGLPAADEAVFEGFLDLSEKMAGGAAAGGLGSAADRGFPGLPLERSETRDGKVTDRFTIQTIAQETMRADELEVPKGLKAIQPPGPPDAPGGRP
jgi:hypothetical protein